MASIQATELNTALPQQEEDLLLSQKITLALPAQPLAASLKALSAKVGLNITFNDALVSGKNAPALSGTMRSKEALQKLLANTGLEAKLNDNTLYIQRIQKVEDKSVNLDNVEVRAKRFYEIGPLPGLGLTKEEIPGNVQSISAKEIKEAHSLSITDLMNRKLQSVTVNDYQGNPFQMDVQYRGFTAGPQIGTPQGLSVFLDGIRVNEPFGDVVNWDMIPMNALSSVDVFPGSNPIFGLNTLGGAFALKTKDGFNNAGSDIDVLTGSYGRKYLRGEAGWNNGTVGLFGAGNFFMEDGWRQNSPSKVNQLFTKASYRGDRLDLNLSTLMVQTKLTGNGLIPTEMYQQDSTSVFSSPDVTRNSLAQFQLSGSYFVNDQFSITGQVYNRQSDRKSLTGDINRDFDDYSGNATRRPTATENVTCAYASTNQYGIPNYYVVSEAFGAGSGAGFSAVVAGLSNGVYTDLAGAIQNGDIDPATFNQTLPIEVAEWIAAGRAIESNMYHGTGKNGFSPGVNYPGLSYESSALNDVGSPANVYSPSGNGTWLQSATDGVYYYQDPNNSSVTHFIVFDKPMNEPCGVDSINSNNSQLAGRQIQLLDSTGNVIKRNGANTRLGNGAGYADGTPTSVISDTQINQTVKGASLQLNWNLDKHKFMVGTSVDHANSTYTNSQRLGLLDANRRAYLDPENIAAEFSAARLPVNNNDFSGLSDTKSLYLSETFSPKDNLHLSFAARYNYTKVSTLMSTRRNSSSLSLMDYKARYMDYLICTGANLDSCDSYLLNNPLDDSRLTGYEDYANPYERESFTYHKLNPSFGATWSPNERLNVYANWSQGTRTPSAIELGCAFDRTPTKVDSNGNVYTVAMPRSLLNGTSCTLPNTLSGDPYLPQVVSRTFEIGARGDVNDQLKWNASLYRSNLFDDIYFVGYSSAQSFFDTIGRTRRQGLELGLTGQYEKADFKINYSLVDATFQSQFQIANQDNSSVNHIPGLPNYDLEQVNPGNRMPGIPLHNLNASFGYQLTDAWRMNLSFVAHGESYARGNENNEHRPGVISYERNTTDGNGNAVVVTTTKRYTQPGKIPGYGVFNLTTSYQLSKAWTATLLINNLFDKEYYSASRLGINPFSPSINGTVGASGWNYNSNDWNSTNFVAPGAPRGVWFSLNWQFQPD